MASKGPRTTPSVWILTLLQDPFSGCSWGACHGYGSQDLPPTSFSEHSFSTLFVIDENLGPCYLKSLPMKGLLLRYSHNLMGAIKREWKWHVLRPSRALKAISWYPPCTFFSAVRDISLEGGCPTILGPRKMKICGVHRWSLAQLSWEWKINLCYQPPTFQRSCYCSKT